MDNVNFVEQDGSLRRYYNSEGSAPYGASVLSVPKEYNYGHPSIPAPFAFWDGYGQARSSHGGSQASTMPSAYNSGFYRAHPIPLDHHVFYHTQNPTSELMYSHFPTSQHSRNSYEQHHLQATSFPQPQHLQNELNTSYRTECFVNEAYRYHDSSRSAYSHHAIAPSNGTGTANALRQGAPPSKRNFSQSSAGGANVKGIAGLTSDTSRSLLDTALDYAKAKDPERTRESDELVQANKNKSSSWGSTFIAQEESIRNDYATHYVLTGERPQNHLRGTAVEERFIEYPKLAYLLELKHALTGSPKYSIPPTYLVTEPDQISKTLTDLSPSKFDVILISPPAYVSFEELSALELHKVASSPGFVWIWVGSGLRGDGIGLERGRELLAHWGYRRCEDIIWLKSNKRTPDSDLLETAGDMFTPSIEHCLMGIRGTVRRSNDPWFVHCNVDTDIIVREEDPRDPDSKPPELQSLIENFCLGTRRLHLYASPSSLRRGWLSVGFDFDTESISAVEGETTAWQASRYDKAEYDSRFSSSNKTNAYTNAPSDIGTRLDNLQIADCETDPEHIGAFENTKSDTIDVLLPLVDELDAVRPKSPPARDGVPSSGGLGRGRGAGLGVTRSAGATFIQPGNAHNRSARYMRPQVPEVYRRSMQPYDGAARSMSYPQLKPHSATNYRTPTFVGTQQAHITHPNQYQAYRRGDGYYSLQQHQ